MKVNNRKALSKRIRGSTLDRCLSISLIIAIVAALGCLGYMVATPQQSEKFTEFYILDASGKAEDYPRQVALGEPIDIVIGIVNHEYQPASYRVGITIDGIENSQVEMGTLAHEEKREKKVIFTPRVAGEKQKVSFYLYKDDENEPYYKEPLCIYIDIVPR